MTTPLTLMIATPAAYSLTRFRFRGRNLIRHLILFSYMVPLLLLGIPMFMIMRYLHILNTRLSLDPLLCCLLPPLLHVDAPVFLSQHPPVPGRGGDGRWSQSTQALQIVLPLSRPGLISCGIFTFVLVWNEYTLALLFIRSESLKTLPIGIAAFIGTTAYEWGYILSAIIMMTVPILFGFIFVQKR